MASIYHAVGKRKTSIARVYLKSGKGQIIINERPFEEYLPFIKWRHQVQEPLRILELESKYDARVTVRGGGVSSQSQAIRHGISKALLLVSSEHKSPLRKAGLLTRDDRIVERKKYGHKKARKSFQFSKR